MFHVVLVFTIIISVGLGAGSHQSTGQVTVAISEPEATADTSPVSSEENQTSTPEAANDWQPEPQVPTGKFTTATEVKPILNATKSAWIAVREYDGNDLLYFTHLAAWRCGLHEIRFSLNGAAEQVFDLEPCHIDTAQPNALKMESHLPYVTYELGSVDSVTVTLTYDDGSKDSAEYGRKDILMP